MSPGRVLFVRSSSTSSSRRQCDGGGRSGLFSNCDSFISSVSCLLCQPPFWGCQSRPKLVPQEAEAAKADGNRCHKRFLLALLAQAHPFNGFYGKRVIVGGFNGF